MLRCPEGHASSTDDWCDVCGSPMEAEDTPDEPSAPEVASQRDDGSAPAQEATDCPACGSRVSAGGRYCESCGFDLVTGTPPPAAGSAFVAEVWVDPDWYSVQDSDRPCPSPGAPVVVPLADRSVLVGRTSMSRAIHPQIDCATDTGVSRRHAQLTTDGQRWWVEDLRSANGTFVGSAAGDLPADPLAPGLRRELAGDDRIYLGAWTRIVVRPATESEA